MRAGTGVKARTTIMLAKSRRLDKNMAEIPPHFRTQCASVSMMGKHSKAGGSGLERLCRQDWVQSTETEYGVEFFEARFQGHAYQKHRHDTYAICLTTTGVLGFDYRGTSEMSTPGQVVVLHPDEVHDGYAGTPEGFGYRELYVEPAGFFLFLQAMCPHPSSPPFVRKPRARTERRSPALTQPFQYNP